LTEGLLVLDSCLSNGTRAFIDPCALRIQALSSNHHHVTTASAL
jgi:hypothetical protein